MTSKPVLIKESILVDQNFNDYFDEGDTYIDKNENGKFDNETISLLPFRHRNSARMDIESKFNKLHKVSVFINFFQIVSCIILLLIYLK